MLASHTPAPPSLRTPSQRSSPRCRSSSSGRVGEDAAGVQQLFNDIAPTYDLLNDVLSAGLHRVWKAAAVQWSRAAPGNAALDVCCGSGDLALRLATAVGSSGSVVGLDFAAAQLDVAARRETEAASPRACNIAWLEGDATRLPFPDASFDAATCGYGLRNVVDRAAALRELRRVLRPGASLAVLDFAHSESALTTAVQSAFLDGLVVPTARLAGAEAEYAYLKQSIESYPTGTELCRMAREAGFSRAVFHELAPGGLMGCLVCS